MIISDDKMPLAIQPHTGAVFERAESPPAGVPLFMLGSDGEREYEIPWPIRLTETEAVNALTGQEIAPDVALVGWRLA